MAQKVASPGGGLADAAWRATQSQGIPLNNPLVDNQRLGSYWVRVGVALAAAPAVTNVAHQLGRVVSCWFVVDKNASADVYRNGAATATNLPLSASHAVTVSLLIG